VVWIIFKILQLKYICGIINSDEIISIANNKTKNMNKKTIVYFIVAVVFLGLIGAVIYKKVHNPATSASAKKTVTYSTSAEYAASIDYSCKKSSDCAIKDVHNCCGAYLQCVNNNAKVDPEFIEKACAKEGIGSICGAPAISQCNCVNNKCEGVKK